MRVPRAAGKIKAMVVVVEGGSVSNNACVSLIRQGSEYQYNSVRGWQELGAGQQGYRQGGCCCKVWGKGKGGWA